MRKVLELPAYRHLLGAYTLNELAWSVGTLALSYLVYRRTGSAVGAAAFYLCAQFVPALLSPLLVSYVDRVPARTLLPILYALESAAFVGLALLVRHFSVVPVLALTLVDGILALVARPLARATTVAVTSRAGLLREGNALINTCFSVSYMVGPAIGGAVVAAGGVAAALFVNAALFLAVAATLATSTQLPRPAAGEAPDGAGRLAIGLAYVRSHRPLRRLLSLQTFGVLVFTLAIPVEVVLTQHSLHAGAGGYGALLSGWGAGAVTGSAVYARWRGAHAHTLIALGAAALGAGFAGMAAAPTLAVAVAAAAVAGVGNGVESVATATALQEETDERWMALVLSFMESLNQITPGAGIALGGAIAALSGPRITLAVGAVGSLAMAGAAWALLNPHRGLMRPAPQPPPL